MAGTFVFKPLQAHLLHDRAHVGKMNPYCEIKIDKTKIKGQIARGGGQSPQWVDVIIIRADKEASCEIFVKNSSLFSSNQKLGECDIDLKMIATKKRAVKWLDIYHKGKKEGELLMEINYKPDNEDGLGTRSRDLYILKERNWTQPDDCHRLLKTNR